VGTHCLNPTLLQHGIVRRCKRVFNRANELLRRVRLPHQIGESRQVGHGRADHCAPCRQILIQLQWACAMRDRVVFERHQTHIQPLQVVRQLMIGAEAQQMHIWRQRRRLPRHLGTDQHQRPVWAHARNLEH
jgi:hypothetical protein